VIFALYEKVAVKVGDEESHVFDHDELLLSQVQEIEKVTGMSWGEWEVELRRYSATAVAALLHSLRKRVGVDDGAARQLGQVGHRIASPLGGHPGEQRSAADSAALDPQNDLLAVRRELPELRLLLPSKVSGKVLAKTFRRPPDRRGRAEEFAHPDLDHSLGNPQLGNVQPLLAVRGHVARELRAAVVQRLKVVNPVQAVQQRESPASRHYLAQRVGDG
jgi:hypothetical protein